MPVFGQSRPVSGPPKKKKPQPPQKVVTGPVMGAPKQAPVGGRSLATELSGFLGSQLSQAAQGQPDQITQSQLADFDEQARLAREQQIADLNRFGIIGGSGVSSGRVADILGRFDADTLRGRQAVQAAGLNRILGTV